MADQTAFEILQSQLGVLAAPIRDYIEAVIKEQTPPVEEEPTPEDPGEETPPEETPEPIDPPVDPEPTDPEEPPIEEPEPEEPTPVVPEMPSTPDTTTVYQIIDYTDGDFEHGINTKLNAVLIRDNNYVRVGHNLRFKNSQGSNITSTEKHQYGMLVKVNAVKLVPATHGAPGAVTLYNKYGKPLDPIVPDPEEPPVVVNPPTGPVDETYLKEIPFVYFEGNTDWNKGTLARNTAIFLTPAYDPNLLTVGSTFKTAAGRVLNVVNTEVTSSGRVKATASEALNPDTEGYPNTIKILTTTASMKSVAYPDAFVPEESSGSFGLIGVNMGMLSNNPGVVPGTPERTYWPWKEDLIKVRAEAGCKLMRMPITANRLSDATGHITPLVPAYMEQVRKALILAQKYGIHVVVDAHSNFKYNGVIQSGEFWANFWVDFYKAFDGMFWALGIANEPYNMSNEDVFSRMQTSTTRLRKAGYKGVIILGGNNYSSAQNWALFGQHLFNIVDPEDNLIFEGHGYLNNSGIYDENSKNVLVTPTAYIEKFQPMYDICKAYGKKMYIGEFGLVKDNASTVIAGIELMKWCVQNKIPATYWADGFGWGKEDQLALYNSSTNYYKPEDNSTLLKYVEPFFKARCESYGPV